MAKKKYVQHTGKSINIIKALKDWSEDLSTKNVVNKTVKHLTVIGENLIKRAYESATYQNNITWNLYSSYVSAVYVNGKLVNDSVRYVGKKTETKKKKLPNGEETSGREEAKKFLESLEGNVKGIKLVIAATMFYADILEKGEAPLTKKYQIISQMSGELSEIAKDIEKKGIYIGRRYPISLTGLKVTTKMS